MKSALRWISAALVATGVSAAWSGHAFADVKIGITVSVGFAVAEVGVPAEYLRMTELAAAALAHAKDTGRNRSEVRLLQPAAEAEPVATASRT